MLAAVSSGDMHSFIILPILPGKTVQKNLRVKYLLKNRVYVTLKLFEIT